MLPPAVRMASEPSCAAPENTTIDITTGATVPITGRARTPNEIAVTATARPYAIPLRTPASSRALSESGRSGGVMAVTGGEQGYGIDARRRCESRRAPGYDLSRTRTRPCG